MQYLSSKDSNLFLGIFLHRPSSSSSLPLKDELLVEVECKDVLAVPEDLLELREEVEEAALVMDVVLLPGVAQRLLVTRKDES